MCGRFNQNTINIGGPDGKRERKLLKWERQAKINIGVGMYAAILTNEGFGEAEFGLRPVWDNTKMLFNARAEGKLNETNNTTDWQLGIHQMPSFKEAFLHRRCILPVSSFIEGTEKEKLSKPYLITTKDKRTMYLAGIYNSRAEVTGEIVNSFAIITTPAIPICKLIGHHRSPVMLYEDIFEYWLDPETSLEELATVIKAMYDEPEMVAYPLDTNKIKSGKLHDAEILNPIGDSIATEFN